jgi:hypothetical protein
VLVLVGMEEVPVLLLLLLLLVVVVVEALELYWDCTLFSIAWVPLVKRREWATWKHPATIEKHSRQSFPLACCHYFAS